MQGTYLCSVIGFKQYYAINMNTKLIYLIPALIFANAQLNAQTTSNSIKGKVFDNTNTELPGATVSLLRAKDSSLIKATITDVAGTYEMLSGSKDSLLLSISSIGLETKYTSGFMLANNETFHVPDLTLKAEDKKLQDVVITSRKPMIEVKADKIVFNIENSINATGSNALELLQKSPGVMVDNNDNISMKGKSGVAIYIDGKPSPLDAKSLADYLRSINSGDIEAIEMISNPSAKYDASGNAGIINIRLKKNKNFGTNGNVSLGFTQGITPKGNGSASLNYRDKKVNIFSNVSGALGNEESDLSLYRIQNDTIYDQHTRMIHKRKNTNIKAGADYFIDDKNTIGVLVNSNISGGSFNTSGNTIIRDEASEQLVKTLKASNYVPNSHINSDFNLNYKYKDTNGTEINFDGDYGLFHSRGSSYQPNYYYSPDNTLDYTVINGNKTPIDINIYTAKLDVTHKLGKGQLSYGGKVAYIKTDNTFDFFNYTDNVPIKDMSLSNQFVYTENVNAAYVDYSRTFNTKWSLQAGLRAEQTNSKGVLTRADGEIQSDNTVKRSYLNLFPTAALTYNLSAKHTLGLTYSRRIDRPDYEDLNPFETKLDQLTFVKGNAFLKPQYTDNVALNYTFMSMVNVNLSYSHVRDYAVQITDTINGNATYLQKQNIAAQQIVGLNVGSPISIKNWWNGYVSLWYNYQTIKGTFNNVTVNLKSPGYGIYMQNSFSLGKDYTTELSGWFNGKGIESAWIIKPMGGMDIGIQKKFMDKRASVKLSVTDLFHTMHARVSSNYGGTNIDVSQTNESRTVRLNFSYRFGSNQIKAARQRKTASESEGGRIK
jgi:iron complex outermembrane receptor protein